LQLGFDEPYDGMVRFWVQDNGLGLTVEPDNLFKATVRGPNTIGRSGHGLGLSIVKRIVEKLNGSVGVQSAPGEGSRFYFMLPAASY